MDVRDHQLAQPLRTDAGDRRLDRGDRLVGIHPAIEQVGLVAVRKQEDVDKAIFEGDGKPELEDSRSHFRQAVLGQHPSIVAANMRSIAAVTVQEKGMSEVQLSPEEIIEALPKYLIPEKAGATKATIQFDLSGDGGGKWWMKIHDGAAETGKGDAPEPANLTMLASADDWVKIATGKLDGTAAFMQGKLKIKGDMGLAIKYQSLFKRPA